MYEAVYSVEAVELGAKLEKVYVRLGYIKVRVFYSCNFSNHIIVTINILT